MVPLFSLAVQPYSTCKGFKAKFPFPLMLHELCPKYIELCSDKYHFKSILSDCLLLVLKIRISISYVRQLIAILGKYFATSHR